MALTQKEKEELELLELEEQEESESKNEQQPKSSNLNDLGGAAVVGSGAALVGAGAYTAGRLFNKPQRQIKSKELLLDKIKNDYLNEPLIASKDLPSRIQLKGNIEQQEMKINLAGEKSKLQSLRIEKGKLSQNLNDVLSDFDNSVLNKTVEEFGLELKNKFPKLVNQTYKNYGNSLDEFTAILDKANKGLFPKAFSNEVIEQTIKDSIVAGVPQEKLGKLLSFRDTFSSEYSNSFAPLKVGHLKGNVDSLSVDLPQAAAIKLRDNWGKFLSNNAPEIESPFHTIQKDYSKFANMRDSLYGAIDGGEFDRSKMNKLLFDFAKSKAETGLTDSIKLMAEGNNVISGIPEIEPLFKRFKGVISGRKTIESSGTSLIKNKSSEIESTLSRLTDIDRQIQESKLKALTWSSKADKILSEQTQIATKYPVRSGGLGKAVLKAGGVAERASIANIARSVVSRAIVPMQVISSLLQAGEFLSDPAVGWGNQLGIDVPKKGTVERAVLEEQINKKPIPPEFNISEEEKFQILYQYGRAL
jgi:hypothetical protein